MTIHYKDYVEKLILLEEKIGHKVGYEILEPSSVAFTSDIVSIQAAAKGIAQFLGLGQYRFIIGMTGKNDKVAADIELKHGSNEVFIELSNNVMEHKMAIPAVLSHEIVHQYLLVERISVPNPLENEVLTDIAAVFLGLGKVMLNGAVTVAKQKDASQTLKVGYLTREQLAYVYLLICSMRGIPSATYETGLREDVITLLKQTRSSYGNHFSLAIPQPDYSDLHHAVYNSKIAELQQQLRTIQIHHEVVKEALKREMDLVWQESHNMAKKWLESIPSFTLKQEEHDPALRYLRHLMLNIDMDRLDGSVSDQINKAAHSRRKFEAVRRSVDQHYKTDGAPDTPMCPIDGSEVTLDRNSEVAVCLDCGYRFSLQLVKWNKEPLIKGTAKPTRRLGWRKITRILPFSIAVALLLFLLYRHLVNIG